MMPEESTTPDLVELARRYVEAGSRRDFDVLMGFLAPDAVWDMSPTGMGIHVGREAIRGVFDDWIGSYDELVFKAEGVVDLGNGVTFAIVHHDGRLAGSAGRVEGHYAAVTVWADGVIVRSLNYANIDDARAVAERLAEERE